MKGAALAPPFSCTTKYSSDVYSPRPPDIRVRLLPTKPPVHFTTEQPGRDTNAVIGIFLPIIPFIVLAFIDGLIKIGFGIYLLFFSKPTKSR
jgi:hypothetical protein